MSHKLPVSRILKGYTSFFMNEFGGTSSDAVAGIALDFDSLLIQFLRNEQKNLANCMTNICITTLAVLV
jgi:hypothetical protein